MGAGKPGGPWRDLKFRPPQAQVNLSSALGLSSGGQPGRADKLFIPSAFFYQQNNWDFLAQEGLLFYSQGSTTRVSAQGCVSKKLVGGQGVPSPHPIFKKISNGSQDRFFSMCYHTWSFFFQSPCLPVPRLRLIMRSPSLYPQCFVRHRL